MKRLPPVGRTGRTRAGAALLCLVLLAVAAGCSSGADDETTTLRVLMTDDWVTAPFLDAVRQFEREHPDVRVSVTRSPINAMADEVRAAAGTGRSPDVVQAHAFSAAAQGLAQPVDDLWDERLERAEFFPGAIEDVTWNGRLYGVPLDTNAMVLMYNADHFAAADLPLPAPGMSFADFERLAAALTAPDGSRRAIALPTSAWWTYGWIRANGGETVSVAADGTPHVTLDATPVVGAFAFLSQLVQKGYAFPPRVAGAHSGDAFALFQSGDVSMHASGSWDLTRARRESPATSFGVTLMPRGTDQGAGTAMGGSSLFVPKDSENRELAFRFMETLVSDQFALRFAKEEGRLPVRLRVFDDPYFDQPDLRVFLEQLRIATPPKLDAFPATAQAFSEVFDAVLREGAAPGPALAKAQQAANRPS